MPQKITQVHNVSPEELTSQIVQAVQLITSQKEKYLEKEKPIGVKEVAKYLGCSPNHVRKQCLYGLHQLKTMPESQDIHIVESEKTAIVMTFFFPHIIWLASGGSNGLQSFKFEALRGRNVCLFPDHSKYELWNEQMERLRFEHPSIKFYPTSIDCEVWHENNEIEKGEDIADYYLMNHKIYG